MAFETRRSRIFILAVTALLLGMTVSSKLAAEGLVSGKQLLVGDQQFVLRLFIATPAPANLIVETTIPHKGGILKVSPPARKIDNDSGKIKWLFKDARSGELSFSVTLDTPVEGPVSTIVRYRSPVDGSYQELRISP